MVMLAISGPLRRPLLNQAKVVCDVNDIIEIIAVTTIPPFLDPAIPLA
jgi:hypothetical protein